MKIILCFELTFIRLQTLNKAAAPTQPLITKINLKTMMILNLNSESTQESSRRFTCWITCKSLLRLSSLKHLQLVRGTHAETRLRSSTRSLGSFAKAVVTLWCFRPSSPQNSETTATRAPMMAVHQAVKLRPTTCVRPILWGSTTAESIVETAS